MSWNLSIPWKNHLDAPHNSLVSSLWVFQSKLSFLHWSHCNRHIIKRWDHTIDVQYNDLVDYTHPPIPIINFILILVDLGLCSRTVAKESLPLIRSGMLLIYLLPLSPRISLSLLLHWWTRLSASIYRRLGFASQRRGSLANQAALWEPISDWVVWLICILAPFHWRTCRSSSAGRALRAHEG